MSQQSNTFITWLTIYQPIWTTVLLAVFGAFALWGIGKLLILWRDRAVRHALVAMEGVIDLKTEYIGVYELQIRAERAVEARQDRMKAEIHTLWDQVVDLYARFCGTTRKGHAHLCELCFELGVPMPTLELPECYRPLAVELDALSLVLTRYGALLDACRVEDEDLHILHAWLAELKERYERFALSNTMTSLRLEHRLAGMREFHSELAKTHKLACLVPAYASFPGEIHILETMLQDQVMPADLLTPYVDALAAQVWKLSKHLAAQSKDPLISKLVLTLLQLVH